MENKKKFPSWLIIVGFLLLIIIFQKYQSQPVSTMEAITIDNIIVFANPNVNYGELGSIPNSEKVLLIGRYGENWVAIKFNGQQAWLQKFYLDIKGNLLRLPEIPAVAFSMFYENKENSLMQYFNNIINSEKYDPEVMVLHKYINDVNFEINDDILTCTLTKSISEIVEFYRFSIDIIFGSILFTDVGGDKDWAISKIEVLNPFDSTSYNSISVSGHDNLLEISKDSSKIYDLLQIDLGITSKTK